MTISTGPAPLGEDGFVSATARGRTTSAPRRQAAVADLLEGTRPVNTRAVLTAALLGAAQPELPVAHLIAVASLFGISAGATRTSLWRMVSDGELTTDKANYALAGRLLERRNQVDTASRVPHTAGSWDGTWELDIVAADRRAAMHRLDLRKAARTLRLAEIREGVWTRPSNLDPEREPEARAIVAQQCVQFNAASADLDARAVASLFELEPWSATAERFIHAMHDEVAAAPYEGEDIGGTLSHQFTLSIAVVTHLERDPLLPEALLPPQWPAEKLRTTYRDFDRHFQRTMNAALGPGHDPNTDEKTQPRVPSQAPG